MTVGDSVEAFALLGDETRVAMIEALVDESRTSLDNPRLSVSDLRERIGRPDSGQFNYHLDKLVGHFVR